MKLSQLIQPIEEKRLQKLEDIFLLLLRAGTAFLMFRGHGLGKFQRLISDDPIKFGDPLGLGPELSFVLVVFAEFFCSILVALGLFTRLALIPLIITMLVAFSFVHINDPFKRMELALLYLFVFSYLFVKGGGGKYSLDFLVLKK